MNLSECLHGEREECTNAGHEGREGMGKKAARVGVSFC